jgi:hypothetical protein
VKVGIAPLLVAVSVAAARLVGLEALADALGSLYLVVATVQLSRTAELAASSRALS